MSRNFRNMLGESPMASVQRFVKPPSETVDAVVRDLRRCRAIDIRLGDAIGNQSHRRSYRLE